MTPLRYALALVLAGCAADSAQAPSPPPRSAAEGSEAAPAPAEQAPLAQGPERYMQEHFILAVYARDAIVNGDLEGLRRPLGEFASFGYDDVAPGGWLPWVAQLQQAARLVASAQSLQAAASGVAAMGRVCGDCHTAMQAGPGFVALEAKGEPPPSESLATRMFRHTWAADQMWSGLIGPSDAAWNAGAEVLARAPSEVSEVSPELAARLSEARQIGQDAREAASPDARTERMAELLATCAGCHAEAQGQALGW